MRRFNYMLGGLMGLAAFCFGSAFAAMALAPRKSMTMFVFVVAGLLLCGAAVYLFRTTSSSNQLEKGHD